MNIKKIFAGVAAASLAVSAMAVAAFAEELKVDEVYTFNVEGEQCFYDIYTDGVFPAFDTDDLILVMVLPEEDETDASDWVLGVLGYDADGNGGKGVTGDKGNPVLVTSIDQLADLNGMPVEDLYEIRFVVTGPENGETYQLGIGVGSEEAFDEYFGDLLDESGAGSTEGPGSDPNKDPVDSGVEGVAVVAGIAVVAAGAIVVAKKRK